MADGQRETIGESILRQQQQLLETGKKLGQFDRIRQREFYSTYLFTPGKGLLQPSGRFLLFNTLKGGTGQGYNTSLTVRETNWPQSGKLSDQQNLVAHALHVSIQRPPADPQVFPNQLGNPVNLSSIDPTIPLHPSDVETIARNCVLEIQYITEKVPMGHLADFPEAGGVWGFRENARQAPAQGQVGPAPYPVGYDATPINAPPFSPIQAIPPWAALPISRNAVAAAFERRFRVPLLIQHGEQFQASINIPKPFSTVGPSPAQLATGQAEYRDAGGCFEIRVGLWCTESFVELS